MSPADSSKLDTLKFDVEVSTWYHEFRRGLFSTMVSCVRAISLVGSIIALFAISGWVEAGPTRVAIVAIVAVVIGIVNLFDLVFQFDYLAREHSSLYQRFKMLQVKIIRSQMDWRRWIDEWESEAQDIRVNEPPTYWALYNICRNMILQKYKKELGNVRVVTPRQRMLRHFKHYQPDDFVPADT